MMMMMMMICLNEILEPQINLKESESIQVKEKEYNLSEIAVSETEAIKEEGKEGRIL